MEKTISIETYQNEVKEAETLCVLLTKPELQRAKESLERMLIVVSLALNKGTT